MTDKNIPEGYKPFVKINDFCDVLQPLYMKYTGDSLRFGMLLEDSHLNALKICHGGVYMTFLDFALSAQACFSLEKFIPTPTISLSMDFVASAKLGDFIWGDVETLRLSRHIAFTQGVIRSGDKILARASATFKLPDPARAVHAVTLEEFAKIQTAED